MAKKLIPMKIVKKLYLFVRKWLLLMGPVLDLKLLQTEFAGEFVTQGRLCRTEEELCFFDLLCPCSLINANPISRYLDLYKVFLICRSLSHPCTPSGMSDGMEGQDKAEATIYLSVSNQFTKLLKLLYE